MDEINHNFDPNDEYMSLDTDNDGAVNVPDSLSDTQELFSDYAHQNSEDVPVETVEDDVFEAFEKAANSTPMQHQADIPQPQPTRYTDHTAPVNTAYQNNVSHSSAPYNPVPPYMYTAPQAPAQYTAPVQYNPPVPPYQGVAYTEPYPARANQPYTMPVGQPQYAAPVAPPPAQPQSANTQHNPYMPPSDFNPYANNSAVKPQKEKTPARTKVLIGVLVAFLVLFMVGFIVSCATMIMGDNTGNDASDNPLAQYGTEAKDFGEEFFGDGNSDFYDSFNMAPQHSGESFEEEITLMADEGDTQVREDDKKENIYAPDESVKDIKVNGLPKDKDNKKYTTQSAYNAVTNSVVSIVCYDGEITDNAEDVVGEGTGTIISSDGYIVTNSHVIGDSKYYTINIVLNNADEYRAKVVGFDTRTDLAVLKIDAKDLDYAKFSDSSLIEVGQDIVAIGNPGGHSFQNSLTKGIISAVDRELQLNSNVNYIQLDAAINPGNSGGPLCNLYGQVIGINTAKIASEEYEGMGFAIPANTVIEIANDLIHYGYVKDRVMLGLMGLQVDEEMIYTYDVPYGILITTINEGGPLDNTDILEYDIITAINGVEVATFQDVYKELAKYKPGDKVTLTLYRLEK